MRVLLAAALVLLAAGEARAQARRDVVIESEPSGADVYLNSKDDGSLCKTPCTIKAPIGEQAVIVELANHIPALESIVVPRRGKAAPLRLKLVRAVGTLIVKGPEGARIRVGDADKGKAPAKLDIDAGPHTVTLTLNGKQVLQELIEIEADQELTLRGKNVATAPTPPDDAPEIIDDTEPGGTGGGGVSTQAPKARPPRGQLVAVSGLVDVGFRRFTYENPMTEILGDEKEGGQIIAGPMIEVWPGTLAGVHALRGFAVIGRFQFPLNKQPVTGEGLMGTTTTFWQSLEISARHRWTFAKGTVDVGAGFVRDQHQFNTDNTSNLARVPDADYRSIRIGVRGSLRLGKVEPYLAAENRIVVSGGDVIEKRFTLGASASGLRGALGATAKLGPVHGILQGAYTRYSWTFKSNTSDMFQADGASDSIFIISAGVGYAY
jgi:hypothetical protein